MKVEFTIPSDKGYVYKTVTAKEDGVVIASSYGSCSLSKLQVEQLYQKLFVEPIPSPSAFYAKTL